MINSAIENLKLILILINTKQSLSFIFTQACLYKCVSGTAVAFINLIN